jgi:hypothetical protein
MNVLDLDYEALVLDWGRGCKKVAALNPSKFPKIEAGLACA